MAVGQQPYSFRAPSIYQHRQPSTYNHRSPSSYQALETNYRNRQDTNIRNLSTAIAEAVDTYIKSQTFKIVNMTTEALLIIVDAPKNLI